MRNESSLRRSGVERLRLHDEHRGPLADNPLFAALEKTPIEGTAPFHLGDRGRGDTPNSSDGVVPYHSSHLVSAQSELIVPGPHGSHDLPQTIKELERILELHIGAAGKTKSPQSKSPSTKKP